MLLIFVRHELTLYHPAESDRHIRLLLLFPGDTWSDWVSTGDHIWSA